MRFAFPKTTILTRYLGLLCDLDGTLADTEPEHRSAWLQILEENYGLIYDEEWFEQYVGTSDHLLSAEVVEENQLTQPASELIQAKQQRFHEIVREEGASFPGVPEALASVVEKGFPLAIATNSGRADTDVVIPALKLGKYTDVVVTATDVENMKPSPDIYLLAAERLGLSAANCIAIEDSNPGGNAARAAGCYLIGLNEGVEAADIVVDSNKKAILTALDMLIASNKGSTVVHHTALNLTKPPIGNWYKLANS